MSSLRRDGGAGISEPQAELRTRLHPRTTSGPTRTSTTSNYLIMGARTRIVLRQSKRPEFRVTVFSRWKIVFFRFLFFPPHHLAFDAGGEPRTFFLVLLLFFGSFLRGLYPGTHDAATPITARPAPALDLASPHATTRLVRCRQALAARRPQGQPRHAASLLAAFSLRQPCRSYHTIARLPASAASEAAVAEPQWVVGVAGDPRPRGLREHSQALGASALSH